MRDETLATQPNPVAMSAWFVAETLPRSEIQAVRHLERQDFACYLPHFRKARRHARRVDHVMAPLFPGYVFVRFDKTRDAWRSINGTRGVRRLISSSGGMPQAMPEAAMEALFARCTDEIVEAILTNPRAGEQVRLLSGPFTDRLARIESLDTKGRVHVLLDILGHHASVEVPMSLIGPV